MLAIPSAGTGVAWHQDVDVDNTRRPLVVAALDTRVVGIDANSGDAVRRASRTAPKCALAANGTRTWLRRGGRRWRSYVGGANPPAHQLWLTTVVPGDIGPAQRSFSSLVVLEEVVLAVTGGRLVALTPSTGAIVRKEQWPSRMGSSCVAVAVGDHGEAWGSWHAGSGCAGYALDTSAGR